MKVDQLIDQNRIGGRQIAIVVLCILVGMVDGLDTQAIAFAAPQMSADLAIPLETFGLVFGAGNLGAMLGAMALSPMADRFGRKILIEMSVLIFALFTLANAFVDDLPALLAVRFMAGIGLGAALPNAITLATEYVPLRRRALLLTVVTSAFPSGAVVGGLASSILLPRYGWHALFLVGGILPLILLLPLRFWLPESVQFLIVTGAPRARIAALLKKTVPHIALIGNEEFARGHVRSERPRLSAILNGAGRLMTPLVWLICFCNLSLIFFVYSWGTPLLVAHGLPLDQAILGIVIFNVGGITGGILLGLICDKFGYFKVLAVNYACVIALLMVMAIAAPQGPTLLILLAAMGVACIGAQTAGNPLVASLYPINLRATGLGWAFGVARIGTFAAPVTGGVMVGLGMLLPQIALILVLLPATALCSLLLLGAVRRRHGDAPRAVFHHVAPE